jgi:hypothetical protein
LQATHSKCSQIFVLDGGQCCRLSLSKLLPNDAPCSVTNESSRLVSLVSYWLNVLLYVVSNGGVRDCRVLGNGLCRTLRIPKLEGESP